MKHEDETSQMDGKTVSSSNILKHNKNIHPLKLFLNKNLHPINLQIIIHSLIPRSHFLPSAPKALYVIWVFPILVATRLPCNPLV